MKTFLPMLAGALLGVALSVVGFSIVTWQFWLIMSVFAFFGLSLLINCD